MTTKSDTHYRDRAPGDRSNAASATCRTVTVLAVTVLLVTAGCLSAPSADDTDVGSTPTPDQTADASNPWGTATLTVGIESDGTWRNISSLVTDALDYWEQHDEAYGTYQVDFTLQPSATDPDVVVRYVSDITACGSANRDGGAGFAPKISPSNPPDPPESICVRRGYNDASTRHIIRHEFGHLLGIGHGDPPTDLMAMDRQYLPVPRPGPAVQSFPTLDGDVAVFVDRSEIFARRDYVAQQQLDHTLGYYENQAGLSVEDISLVDSEQAADIVITFPQQAPCPRDRPGSCATVETRADGTSQLRVSISTTHEDTYGWHAGFWLAVAFGADEHGDLPPPFRNASFDDRHSEWWSHDS